MHGLKSAILAIFQKGLGWPCPVSAYSFMLKYSKITVCSMKYVATAYTCFECKLCLGKNMFLCQELCKTYVG